MPIAKYCLIGFTDRTTWARGGRLEAGVGRYVDRAQNGTPPLGQRRLPQKGGGFRQILLPLSKIPPPHYVNSENSAIPSKILGCLGRAVSAALPPLDFFVR